MMGLYETILYGMAVIAGGFLLDLLFGDPAGRFHPVCLMGRLISFLDRRLYRREDAAGTQFAKGLFLVLVVLLSVFVISEGLFLGLFFLHPAAGIVFALLLADAALAMRDLKAESMAVKKALEEQGLEAGRKAVSRIVGRDTQALDEAGVLRAAVETVAESTTDGVVAPLFWLFLGGPVVATLYKAVNTMDSMIGYKNERYRHLGTAAAGLDDLMNFLPARLAGVCMCLAAGLCGEDMRGAFLIFRRDRRKHESPNSAHTESACAGALGLRLAGDAFYFGKKKEKPFIGDAKREICGEDIARANRLMLCTAGLVLLAGMLLRGGCLLLLRYMVH